MRKFKQGTKTSLTLVCVLGWCLHMKQGLIMRNLNIGTETFNHYTHLK